MADILGVFNHIQQQGEKGKQSGLARLLGQAYNAPQDQRQAALGKIAQHDGALAMQADNSFRQSESEAYSQLADRAKAVVAMWESNPQMAQSAYASMLPIAQRAGIGNVPPQLDASLIPGLKTLASAGARDETPSQQRYAEWLLSQVPEDQRDQTLGVLAGYKARPSGAAIQYKTIKGADGREYTVALDPQEIGAQTVGGGPAYGSFAPQQAPQQPMPGGDMFAGLESIPGVQVTSGLRTPERNQEVGGVPNSYHLTGQARDIAPPSTQEQAQQIRQYAAANGLEVIDEGDHWHLEPRGGQARMQPASNPGPQGGQLPPRLDYQNGGIAGNPFASRTPEEQAALTRQAEQEVDIRYLPLRGEIDARNAALKTQAEKEVTTGAERAVAQEERDATFELYDAAMSAAINGMDGAITGPFLGRLPALTERQQIAEGGVAAMAPVLKQIFRVAGEGTFTDKDQEMLTNMLPTRTDLPAARRAKAAAIDQIVRAKLRQGPAPSQDAPASGAVRRARNPQTGEMLELRNGQWVPAR